MTSKSRVYSLLTVLSILLIVTTPGMLVNADQPRTPGGIFGAAATVDNEGSLIVIGSSSPFSNGQSQAFFFKYVSSLPDSPLSQRACMKTFGDAEPLETFGYAVATDSSNNIYIAGTTQTFGGEDYDVFVQKYTESCNLLFTKQWGGAGNDIAHGIAVDAVDNVYITGTTDSFGNGVTQTFLLKYSPSGDLQFSKTWGSGGNSYGNGVATDSLGDIYVVGTTTIPSSASVGAYGLLLKYDSFGNLLFERTWGNGNDYGTAVTVDPGGYVYATGYSYSLGPTVGISSVIVLKYDSAGNLLFQGLWGGIRNDYASGIAVDIDGNIYVTGYTKSYSITPGIPSAFLLKFDPAGNLLFQRVWGGNRGDFGYGVAVDIQENAYITGYTYSFGPNTQGANFFLIGYDRSGNLLYQRFYGGGIPDP
jgi:hypothetical protein